MASAKRKLDKSKPKPELVKLRLDKWLWAARFFKTRKLASEAVNGGKVHLNSLRVKSAKNVVCDDGLEITRGVDVFNIVVLGLNDKRRPASEARQLYEESAASIEKRENAQELRKLVSGHSYSNKKPDKRDRRKIRQFKEGG